jgi:hypothetical protein
MKFSAAFLALCACQSASAFFVKAPKSQSTNLFSTNDYLGNMPSPVESERNGSTMPMPGRMGGEDENRVVSRVFPDF